MNGAAARPDQAARLDEVAEHAAQARRRRRVACLRRLLERPRLLRVDRLVGAADELPERGERVVEQVAVELPAYGARVVDQAPASGGVARGAGLGPLAAEVAVDHRHRPVDEVAEVVGEVGVVAADERVPGDVGVAVERDLAQRHVAGPVGSERRDHGVRVQEVAAALAHPLALDQQPAVDPDVLRGLEAGGPEHRRPVDRVEAGDVLADDVEVGGPPALEGLVVAGKPAPVM